MDTSLLAGGLRQLKRGETIQRGDLFIVDGHLHSMSRSGVLLGVMCLGNVISKDNGDWYRPVSTKPLVNGESCQ